MPIATVTSGMLIQGHLTRIYSSVDKTEPNVEFTVFPVLTAYVMLVLISAFVPTMFEDLAVVQPKSVESSDVQMWKR